MTMSDGVETGFIETGDHCRIAWQMEGAADAPVVVLSNSLGTAMAMWNPQVAVLATHFRILRYDTRGHGVSAVPAGAYSLDRLGRDVLELTDELGIERFTFCGLSLGGMTGQWLGARVPESLEALVIANSSPFMGPPSAWDARIDTVMAKGMASISDAVVERWFTPEFRADAANTAAILEVLMATDPAGYAGCCAAIRDMDMRALLPLVRARTLVIGGTQDPATPPDHTALLTDGIADAQCAMLEASHLSNLERPDAFNRVLLKFLGGQS